MALKGVLEMVLYRLPTLGVLEFEDEVNLVGGATLVRSKHYGVSKTHYRIPWVSIQPPGDGGT
jgi:hypothetical protein